MKFYSRNDILYVRLNGKRVSTKLKDTKANRKLVMSYYKNDEFFKKFDVNKSVPKLVDLCYEVLERKEIKPSTYITYLSLINSNIVPFFNKMLVNEVTPILIKKFYFTFRDKSTLNTCMTVLHEVFEDAILNGYIIYTPSLGIKKPRLRSSYRVNPFRLEEMELIISNTRGQFRNLIAFLFFTGARIGEMLALRWNEVDLYCLEININRTKTKGYEQEAKTQSSIRTVDIIDTLFPFIKDQKKITGLSSYVFMSEKYKKPFFDSSAFYRDWKKLLASLNIEYRSIHHCRHTFASQMLLNGEDLLYVSSILGHNDSSVTLKKYARYMKKKKKKRGIFFQELDTKLAQ